MQLRKHRTNVRERERLISFSLSPSTSHVLVMGNVDEESQVPFSSPFSGNFPAKFEICEESRTQQTVG